MSQHLIEISTDELITVAHNYSASLMPITTYSEIMHELVRRLEASRRNADVLAIEINELKQRLATSSMAECNTCNDGIRGGCSSCSYNIK